jgi:hypothetical protein
MKISLESNLLRAEPLNGAVNESKTHKISREIFKLIESHESPIKYDADFQTPIGITGKTHSFSKNFFQNN